MLALAWTAIVKANPKQILMTATLQDSSRTIIFFLLVAAACTSLFAVAFLLGTAKGLPKNQLAGHVALSIITVLCSWLLMQTVFTLRYAHLFYGGSNTTRPDHPAGGLDFPHERQPEYLEFAYFAFVIGMTCQVSDVQITSRTLRRLALLHGILSFAFNAVILALTINIISGLF